MSEELAVMTPTTELALPQDTTPANIHEQFDDMVSSFLPRLQLFDSNSKPCKQKLVNQGHYGLVVNGNVSDLGDEIKLFIVALRSKAMDLNNGVRSYYDPTNIEFTRIQGRSKIKNSGCMCGPEFLVYMPDLRKFATFFMSSPTLKREAPNVKSQLGKACTLRSRLIDDGKYTWYGPVSSACSVPLDPPPADKMHAEIEKFKNPPVEETETVEEKPGGRDR